MTDATFVTSHRAFVSLRAADGGFVVVLDFARQQGHTREVVTVDGSIMAELMAVAAELIRGREVRDGR